MHSISIAEHTQFANPCCRVAVEHEGKYLMVQEGKPHVYGLWAFPGGKMDVGELITESITREIVEETSIEIELKGLLGIYHTLWENKPGYTTEYEFLATAKSIPDSFPVSDEVLAVEWKSLEEVRELANTNKLRNPSQEGILRMLESKAVLPINSILELAAAPAPPEAK